MSVASSVAAPRRPALARPRAGGPGRLGLLFAVIVVTSVSAFALALMSAVKPLGHGDALPGYGAIAPHRDYAWAFFVIAGVQLIIGACAAALAGLLLARERGARWATAGASLVWLGAALYGVGIGGWAALYYFGTDPHALAPGVGAQLFHRFDHDGAHMLAVPFGGALLIALGSLLIAVALWRARSVPRWVPVVGALSAVATVVLPPDGAAGLVGEAASSVTTVAMGWYACGGSGRGAVFARRAAGVAALVVVSALCGCGGASGGGGGHTTSSASKTPAVIDGRYDVGARRVYLHCDGSGSPTVVYVHGFIDGPGSGGARSAGAIPGLVAPTTRICVYDRANVGRSDAAPWPITSRETISDLHVALHAAGVKPPYELLGASFGGLIAYVYAATYPDEVKGMVLLDAAFPQELGLERYFPPDQRLTHAEFKADREKLDQLDVYEQAQHLDPPRIPVTYLLAVPSTWTGPPAYNRVVLRRMADYVRGFAPGTLKRVRSPHYMEAAVPGTIAREVKALAARIRAQPTS